MKRITRLLIECTQGKKDSMIKLEKEVINIMKKGKECKDGK